MRRSDGPISTSNTGTVRIERSLTQVGKILTEKGTKTNRGRTVAIDGRTVALLEHHRAWQIDLSTAGRIAARGDPYVLSDNANGARPMQPSKITDRFTSLRDTGCYAVDPIPRSTPCQRL